MPLFLGTEAWASLDLFGGVMGFEPVFPTLSAWLPDPTAFGSTPATATPATPRANSRRRLPGWIINRATGKGR